jgi:PleD family two-component response regulator
MARLEKMARPKRMDMTSHKPTHPFQADILVVDDNPDNVRLLINILGKHGYKVRPATSGPRAVAVARTESPAFPSSLSAPWMT